MQFTGSAGLPENVRSRIGTKAGSPSEANASKRDQCLTRYSVRSRLSDRGERDHNGLSSHSGLFLSTISP